MELTTEEMKEITIRWWSEDAEDMIKNWANSLPKGYKSNGKPSLNHIFKIVWGGNDERNKRFGILLGVRQFVSKFFFDIPPIDKSTNGKVLIPEETRRISKKYSGILLKSVNIPVIKRNTNLTAELKNIAKVYRCLGSGKIPSDMSASLQQYIPLWKKYQSKLAKEPPKSAKRKQIIKLYSYLNSFLKSQKGAREYGFKKTQTNPYLDKIVSKLIIGYSPKQIKKTILDSNPKTQ